MLNASTGDRVTNLEDGAARELSTEFRFAPIGSLLALAVIVDVPRAGDSGHGGVGTVHEGRVLRWGEELLGQCQRSRRVRVAVPVRADPYTAVAIGAGTGPTGMVFEQMMGAALCRLCGYADGGLIGVVALGV